MQKKIGVVLIYWCATCITGRDNVYYPNFFNSYFFSMYQLSPAYLPQDQKIEVSGNYRALTGELKKISAYSFSAARIFRNEKDRAHAFRVSFYNEREGSFISSPRFMGGYTYKQKLMQDLEMYVGASFGMTGIYYSAPTVTQSSVMLPDGSLGLGMIWKGFKIDMSSHQIFSSSKYSISSPMTLERYYHLFAGYTFDINHNWKSKSYTLYRAMPYIQNELLLATSVTYNELFTIGLAHKYMSGISFFTAFDITQNNDLIQVFFNYNSAAFKLAPRWQGGLELGINYWMK